MKHTAAFSEASAAIAGILSRAEGSARATLAKVAGLDGTALGAELDRCLRPAGRSVGAGGGNAAREAAAHAAFWQGAVLLEPTPPPVGVDDVLPGYVAALDRQVAALAPELRQSEDARAVRAEFADEAVAAASLGRQFIAALAQLLEQQALVRPVSSDELSLRAGWMRERLLRLLDARLEAATARLRQLQTSASSVSAPPHIVRLNKRRPVAPPPDANTWRTQAQPVRPSAAAPPALRPVVPLPPPAMPLLPLPSCGGGDDASPMRHDDTESGSEAPAVLPAMKRARHGGAGDGQDSVAPPPLPDEAAMSACLMDFQISPAAEEYFPSLFDDDFRNRVLGDLGFMSF